ncbi:MAG: hypothetical protein FWH17_06765 [Oscillospiraceae bacterium]|nr:hypothetical protein [Oscillospiraceae bacterium]
MKNEKKVFTKREKTLLFGLMCIGILTIMLQFVLVPLYNWMSDSTEEYNALAVEKSQMELALATETDIRARHAEAVSYYDDIHIIYSSESLSSDIGLMLTKLVESHDLLPISQTIQNPVNLTVPDADGEESTGDPIFNTVSVTMVVLGDYDAHKSLLDEVEDIEYIRISSVGFSFAEDDSGRHVSGRTTIRFEVLMLIEDLVDFR